MGSGSTRAGARRALISANPRGGSLLAEVPNIAEAARLMHNMIVSDDVVEFLTPPAYEMLG